MTIRMHFKSLGIRVGEKVFAYNEENRTLGVRFKFRHLEKTHGWAFREVALKEWRKFTENPEAASKLTYWFGRGQLIPDEVEISFMGIWNCKNPQLPLSLIQASKLVA